MSTDADARAAQLGDIVLYELTEHDLPQIRTGRGQIGRRGNEVAEGQVFPALVVRTWGDAPGSAVQLQVFLDGNDVHWATSRTPGNGPGHFRFRS